jgi:transcriptional regulator with XRE-family HTH domain
MTVDTKIAPAEANRDIAGVAERLRLSREHAGLSQAEFADRIGYSRRQVISWETGVTAPPIWAVMAVRRECNVDPEWVLLGPGIEPLHDAVPREAGREQRLAREVAAMAREMGFTLKGPQVTHFVKAIMEEKPDAEAEAKRHLRKAFRAFSMGQDGHGARR